MLINRTGKWCLNLPKSMCAMPDTWRDFKSLWGTQERTESFLQKLRYLRRSLTWLFHSKYRSLKLGSPSPKGFNLQYATCGKSISLIYNIDRQYHRKCPSANKYSFSQAALPTGHLTSLYSQKAGNFHVLIADEFGVTVKVNALSTICYIADNLKPRSPE